MSSCLKIKSNLWEAYQIKLKAEGNKIEHIIFRLAEKKAPTPVQ